MELASQRPESSWVEAKEFQGTLTRLPEASELPAEFDVSKVVEFYSK
jgi:ribosomal protein S4